MDKNKSCTWFGSSHQISSSKVSTMRFIPFYTRPQQIASKQPISLTMTELPHKSNYLWQNSPKVYVELYGVLQMREKSRDTEANSRRNPK